MKIIKKIDGYNRVTIPMPVRELLGVSAGMDVEFILEDGRVWMRIPQEEEAKSRTGYDSNCGGAGIADRRRNLRISAFCEIYPPGQIRKLC